MEFITSLKCGFQEDMYMDMKHFYVEQGTRGMIKEEHTRLIAAEIPGARLVIMEGDHFIANKRAEVLLCNI